MTPDPEPAGYELVGTVHVMPSGVTLLEDDAGVVWPLPILFRELEGRHVRILAKVVP